MSFSKETLEFNLILEEISSFSATLTTKNNILSLMPLNNLDDIISKQNKISEAMTIISRSGGIPFLQDFDILDVLNGNNKYEKVLGFAYDETIYKVKK